MDIELKFNKDFERALEALREKYGEDFEILNGIHNSQMNFSDFIDAFVDRNVLEAEVLLRKVFGDEIYVSEKVEEKLTGDKEIVKLTEDDMVFDGQVREICENIEDYEFDNNVGMIVSKVNVGDK